jgi:hypothetical protein
MNKRASVAWNRFLSIFEGEIQKQELEYRRQGLDCDTCRARDCRRCPLGLVLRVQGQFGIAPAAHSTGASQTLH